MYALGFYKEKILTEEANVHNLKKCFDFFNSLGHDNKSPSV